MLYELAHTVIPPVVKGIWRPKVTGLKNVRTISGRGLGVPRGMLMRQWFEGLGHLPVDRSDAQSALDSLDVALDVLRRGEAFGIYPEGTRSLDGRLYRGRTGVAHLALTAQVPIVPVGLRDTEKLQPVGSKTARLVRVSINFGEPIHVAGRYDDMPTGRARREVTDRVMAAIARLSGQEQAGVYNDLPAEG